MNQYILKTVYVYRYTLYVYCIYDRRRYTTQLTVATSAGGQVEMPMCIFLGSEYTAFNGFAKVSMMPNRSKLFIEMIPKCSVGTISE